MKLFEKWKFSTRDMYVNPRRVGKKKPLDPRPTDTNEGEAKRGAAGGIEDL
jgi:hypothetical protein